MIGYKLHYKTILTAAISHLDATRECQEKYAGAVCLSVPQRTIPYSTVAMTLSLVSFHKRRHPMLYQASERKLLDKKIGDTSGELKAKTNDWIQFANH